MITSSLNKRTYFILGIVSGMLIMFSNGYKFKLCVPKEPAFPQHTIRFFVLGTTLISHYHGSGGIIYANSFVRISCGESNSSKQIMSTHIRMQNNVCHLFLAEVEAPALQNDDFSVAADAAVFRRPARDGALRVFLPSTNFAPSAARAPKIKYTKRSHCNENTFIFHTSFGDATSNEPPQPPAQPITSGRRPKGSDARATQRRRRRRRQHETSGVCCESCL